MVSFFGRVTAASDLAGGTGGGGSVRAVTPLSVQQLKIKTADAKNDTWISFIANITLIPVAKRLNAPANNINAGASVRESVIYQLRVSSSIVPAANGWWGEAKNGNEPPSGTSLLFTLSPI